MSLPAVKHAGTMKDFGNAACLREEWPHLVHTSPVWPTVIIYRLVMNESVNLLFKEVVGDARCFVRETFFGNSHPFPFEFIYTRVPRLSENVLLHARGNLLRK